MLISLGVFLGLSVVGDSDGSASASGLSQQVLGGIVPSSRDEIGHSNRLP